MSSKSLQRELLAKSELERRVREKMRDFPELNTLITGQENSAAQIYSAIDIAVSTAREMPPPIGWPGLDKIPLYIIQPLVVSELLESAALLYLRNDISFATGGSTVQFTQGQTYLQMAAQMRAEAQANLLRWKVSQNHQQAIDAVSGIHSEFVWINTRPISWYTGAVYAGKEW